MKCSHARELLSLAVDEALDEAQALPVEAHLQVCASCTQYFDSLHAMKDLLAELPPSPVPQSFMGDLRERIQEPAGASAWVDSWFPTLDLSALTRQASAATAVGFAFFFAFQMDLSAPGAKGASQEAPPMAPTQVQLASAELPVVAGKSEPGPASVPAPSEPQLAATRSSLADVLGEGAPPESPEATRPSPPAPAPPKAPSRPSSAEIFRMASVPKPASKPERPAPRLAKPLERGLRRSSPSEGLSIFAPQSGSALARPSAPDGEKPAADLAQLFESGPVDLALLKSLFGSKARGFSLTEVPSGRTLARDLWLQSKQVKGAVQGLAKLIEGSLGITVQEVFLRDAEVVEIFLDCGRGRSGRQSLERLVRELSDFTAASVGSDLRQDSLGGAPVLARITVSE